MVIQENELLDYVNSGDYYLGELNSIEDNLLLSAYLSVSTPINESSVLKQEVILTPVDDSYSGAIKLTRVLPQKKWLKEIVGGNDMIPYKEYEVTAGVYGELEPLSQNKMIRTGGTVSLETDIRYRGSQQFYAGDVYAHISGRVVPKHPITVMAQVKSDGDGTYDFEIPLAVSMSGEITFKKNERMNNHFNIRLNTVWAFTE